MAPPAAWAFLLAERSPGPRRRQAWTRTVLTGGGLLLAAATLAVPLAPLLGGVRPPGWLAGSTLSGLVEALR
ncbi:MAG TPA: hypothetical protein VG452_00595 [Egibacteraceae bacterium]|nr:hypothetical protein [Egibacteraceae bacterium]